MDYRFDFIRPEYYKSVLKYRYLLMETNSETDGCGSIEKYENIESWDFNNKLFEDEVTVPHGFSIGFQYLYIDSDNEVVGMLNFRPKAMEHEHLKKYGGHIGYNIRPDKRGLGLGTRMLKDFLSLCKEKYCQKYNLDKILITCLENNEASRKIILNNNGVFENKVVYTPNGQMLERYWITL